MPPRRRIMGRPPELPRRRHATRPPSPTHTPLPEGHRLFRPFACERWCLVEGGSHFATVVPGAKRSRLLCRSLSIGVGQFFASATCYSVVPVGRLFRPFACERWCLVEGGSHFATVVPGAKRSRLPGAAGQAANLSRLQA